MAEIGWHGIRMVVPDDWEPGQFAGDFAAGHIRIDSMMLQRAVVRWLPASSTKDVYRRTSSHIEGVEEICANYLKAITKAERKQKHTLKTESSTRLIPKRQLGKRAVRFYSWRCEEDGRQGHGLVWYCDECERTVIAEVDGEKGEDVRSMAAQVLGTLSDHGEGEHFVWSVFGLRVLVPDRFRLSNSTMMGGKVELRLENAGEIISLQRWVANVALAGRDLETWAKADILKPMRKEYTFRHKQTQVFTHDAISVNGYKKGIVNHIAYVAGKFLRRERPFFLDGRLWECPAQNKLFTVHTLTREPNRSLIDSIIESSQCGSECGGDDS